MDWKFEYLFTPVSLKHNVHDISEDMHHNLQRSLHTDSFPKKKKGKYDLSDAKWKTYAIYIRTKMFNLNANLEEQINFATTYDSCKRSKVWHRRSCISRCIRKYALFIFERDANIIINFFYSTCFTCYSCTIFVL